jgi:cellulose biosynthesis protein BcsQ
MVQKIALFNHKGGVSKTTTTFNLGWMLAKKGKKVILVDTDPQCNLTGLVLGYSGQDEFENFYETQKNCNIRDALTPAFESRPILIKPVDCIPVKNRENLFLLPGHIRLSEYEVTLGIAQELSGSIQTLQNLPGAIHYLLEKTAEKFEADYMLIDMSPSLSAINQNLLMISDFFIVPTSPDFFSVMGIDSLTAIFPKWHEWARKACSLPILKQAEYPFPEKHPKFLGMIIQKYQPYSEKPASSFQKWIDDIKKDTKNKLVPALQAIDMMLPIESYQQQSVADFCLASISDFKSLIAKSQKHQTPVFELLPEQLRQSGVVFEQSIARRDEFEKNFSELADNVIGLTNYAGSN